MKYFPIVLSPSSFISTHEYVDLMLGISGTVRLLTLALLVVIISIIRSRLWCSILFFFFFFKSEDDFCCAEEDSEAISISKGFAVLAGSN